MRSHSGLAVARVMTPLDSKFRVRVRREGSSAMLWGTGKTRDGRAVLEIKHLVAAAELKPDDAVFTEGNDGVFPPGILVGRVAEEDEGKATRRLVVVAALAIEELSSLVFPVDLSSQRLLEARRIEREEARRP
jgi:rod shape-determining protein MreC